MSGEQLILDGLAEEPFDIDKACKLIGAREDEKRRKELDSGETTSDIALMYLAIIKRQLQKK